MKALIIGDVHLGKGVSIGKPGNGQQLNSRNQDKLNLLQWCLKKAKEYKVTHLFFTGDIFEDSQPDWLLVAEFFKFLKQCSDFTWHIIPGNHDIKRRGSLYFTILSLLDTFSIGNGKFHLDPHQFCIDNIGITLLPFRDRLSLEAESQEQAQELLKKMITPTFTDASLKILIGHQTIEGSLYVGDEIDDVKNEIFCPINMFNNYDYVWMGHIHKPQVLSKSNPYVAHVGSLDISDFGETNHNKIIVLFDSEREEKFIHLEVPTRTLHNISIVVPEGLDPTTFLLEELQKIESQKTIYDSITKIDCQILDKNVAGLDREKIEKYLHEQGIHHLATLSESRVNVVVPLEKRNNLTNITDPEESIKAWAEKETFDSESLKDDCLKRASEIIKLVKEKKNVAN